MLYYIIVTVHSQMHLMADAQGSKNIDTCQSHGKTARKPITIVTFHADAAVLHQTRTCSLKKQAPLLITGFIYIYVYKVDLER